MQEISIPILEKRIIELEKIVSKLTVHLNFALSYLESDPKSSVVKSRMVLENIIKEVYLIEMGIKLGPPSILGVALHNEEFLKKIKKNVIPNLINIREWGNLGPHDTDSVSPKNAMVVLDSVCEVINWYWKKYHTKNNYSQTIDNMVKDLTENSRLDLKAGDHIDYIQTVLKNDKFWEKIITLKQLERATGKSNHNSDVHFYDEWKESIYSENENICGISIPFHEEHVFLVCVLLKIEQELKFRFSVLYSNVAYFDQVDFINNQFNELGLEGRQFKGYYEGYKFLPYPISDPEIHHKIKNEIENVLK